MIKSSLLYADHVNLVTPGLNMLWTLAPLRSITKGNVLDVIAHLPTEVLKMMGVPGESVHESRDKFLALSRLPRNHPARVHCEKQFAPVIADALKSVNENFGEHAPEIDVALASNAITMVDAGFDFNEGHESVMTWYQEQLAEALANPSTTVLLDPETSLLARRSGHDAHLGSYAASRSKRAATGTGLIERLPTFPDAPIEHVLEAREELADGREGYRKAVKNFSAELESAALDESLPFEIHELWYDEVQPRLVDLQKSVKLTRIGRETARTLVAEKASANSIAIVVAGFGNLASLFPTAESAAVAGGGLTLAATRQAMRAHAARRKHDLVYLLEADKQLGDLRRS